jgi:hypothetical protein
MSRVRALIGAVMLAASAALAAAPAGAQPITDTHLQAAIEAYRALGTDAEFDLVLPGVAEQVATVLISQRPDLHTNITALVVQVAIELVARRAELTNDIARVWAQAFTEEELRAITAFYTSPVGRKLAEMGEPVMNETVTALQAWSERLGTELLDRVLQEFERQAISF